MREPREKKDNVRGRKQVNEKGNENIEQRKE